jgi:FAD/FMN-containing dehydrogenase
MIEPILRSPCVRLQPEIPGMPIRTCVPLWRRTRATLIRTAVVSILFGVIAHVPHACADAFVSDITQLNPIPVREIVAPTSTEAIIEAVKNHTGPISIGGGRYSMGGQTATDGALQIDMRRFDQVVSFSRESKLITVQAGITWRKIQEYIDPYNLSVEIMQSYDNFTVGGSLSVNAHGRYVGLGPIVLSVKSIRLVLADGSVVSASPTENSDLFYGAIGGYGALGIIAEATLQLADNVRVEEHSQLMPLSAYRAFFNKNVRNNGAVIFHNADIFPSAFDVVRVTSYTKTDKPVTISERLTPADADYSTNRRAIEVVSEWPGGKWMRQHVLDPWLYRKSAVEWRNYEASYDVRELEPVSRKLSTFVLQEYFVPASRLDEFVPRMAEVLRRHHVNVINISIRHSRPDPGTYLAWAKSEVFCLVIYYKQGTAKSAQQEVQAWTRELIDRAIGEGGTYYLPYQILATKEQFYAAYPRARDFFKLKNRVDPGDKFRNRLLDAYYESGDADAH